MSEKRTELKLQLEELLHELDRTQSKAKGQDTMLEQMKRQEIKKKVSQVVNSHISSTREHVKTAFDSAMEEIERELSTLTSDVTKRLMPEEKSQSEVRHCLFSQKVHKKESALLVRMMKYPDFKTILNIFVAVLLVMLSAEIAKDYINHGTFVDLSLFEWAMGKLHIALTFWLVQNFWAWLVVPLVQVIRADQMPKMAWVLFYSFLQVAMYTVSFWFAVHNSLPIGSGFVVTCEMARLSMKMHSYLREKLLYGNGPNQYSTFMPEFLRKRGFTEEDLHNPTIDIQSLSTETARWLKFCFTPTLIYRDHYPVLAAKHRWDKVFEFFLNIVMTILFVFIIFRQLCIPHLNESWKQPLNLKLFLTCWLESMLPATLLLLLLFFGFLHSWQNLWAELMLYGDRHFYDDWWNVSSFGAYYRKWNIVVHEWLYHYIYQDIVRFSKGKISRGFSFIFVFVFSDIIHEVVLAASLGFFYPILLLLFGGPGIIFIQFTKNKKEPWNIFVWAMLLVGTGLIIIFYSWEFYARQSLDLSPQYGFWAWFIPHSWIPLGLVSN
jgi:sterol O-acyltransferase